MTKQHISHIDPEPCWWCDIPYQSDVQRHDYADNNDHATEGYRVAMAKIEKVFADSLENPSFSIFDRKTT